MEVIRVAFPFMPMTNEMLKKLSRAIEDSDQTINFPDFPAVFVSCEFKFALDLIPSPLETDQTDTPHL
jgi:hypothetical protein